MRYKTYIVLSVIVNKEIITRATVYGIIPSVKSLIKLADYLKLPLSYLLGESDKKNFYPIDK